MIPSTKYVFFGTGPLAESVLAALVNAGHIPALVVTKPDSPQGRHMHITAPYIKTWAEMKNILVIQPEKLDEHFSKNLSSIDCDLFIIASYGKIIPENILDIPKHGALNVHPSLLPKYRGASPVESVLLSGDITTGVSIIKLDKEIDHGPILIQSAFIINPQSTTGTLEVECGQMGGRLLVQVLPSYVVGSLIPKEQDHSQATHCKKIEKSMGEIRLNDDAGVTQRKFRALTPWPGLYFFITHKDKRIRVKVTSLDLTSNAHNAEEIIEKVIPEGKHEISWEDFKRGYAESLPQLRLS